MYNQHTFSGVPCVGFFSSYLECSQVDKRNTWGLAGNQEELGDAREHLFLQSWKVGVTVHLMFSCPPFPGSETQPCSAFQDVHLSYEAPAAGGDAGVENIHKGLEMQSVSYHLD